jgi:membrane-bound metal-dependent hydrolase YbcI (DUF457 family)
MDFKWVDYFKHHFFQVIICLLIGIASHIFWDAFTHPRGDFVKMIPFLRESSILFGYHIPNNRILQYASTVVGGIIVFYAVMKIPRAKEYAPSNHPVYYWFIVIGMGVVAANIRILAGLHYTDYVTVATSAATGCIAGAIIAPLFLEKRVVKV